MKIFIVLKDLHVKLPGITMLDFFWLPRWQGLKRIKTRFGTYENMMVLYVRSGQSHVSGLDNRVSLRLIVSSSSLHTSTNIGAVRAVGDCCFQVGDYCLRVGVYCEWVGPLFIHWRLSFVSQSRARGIARGLTCGLCVTRQWFSRLFSSCCIKENMFVKVETKEYCFLYCWCHVLEGFRI